MKMIDYAIVATGLVPYLLLVRGIASGKVRQSFATWMLWLVLDIIVLTSLLAQKASPVLFGIFTAGTLAVTLMLLVKKQFAWKPFDSLIAVLVAICIIVFCVAGPYMATIATTAALGIASIPQVTHTYRDPHSTPTAEYLLFTLSSVLAVISAPAWTVQDRLPQMNSALFCATIVVLTLRKPDQNDTKDKAREIQQLLKQYLSTTSAYCAKTGINEGSPELTSIRTSILKRECTVFLGIFEKKMKHQAAEDSAQQSADALFEELGFQTTGTAAIMAQTRGLLEDNICTAAERHQAKTGVFFHDLIFICALYPAEGRSIFSIRSFANGCAEDESIFLAVQTVLQEAIEVTQKMS